jgi:hypothetical protein
MSGLSHTPGKRTKGKTFRGFESRPLRQHVSPEFSRIQGFFVPERTVPSVRQGNL